MRVPVRAPMRDGRNGIRHTSFAAPLKVWYVDARLRLRRDDVLMCHEALVELRLEHPIGQNELVGHIKVWLRLAVRHVYVLTVGRPAVLVFFVEAVHPALRSGKLPGSVAGGKHRRSIVRDIVPRFQGDRLKRDRLAVRVLSARNGVGAGIALEHVVEAAILLNDVDHVLDGESCRAPDPSTVLRRSLS